MSKLPIEQLYAEQDVRKGACVEVEGTLFVTSDGRAYIATGYDDFVAQKRMELSDSGTIANWCRTNLAPYGGGNCMFMEPAVVAGTLRVHGASSSLEDISACTIRTDEGSIELPIAID